MCMCALEQRQTEFAWGMKISNMLCVVFGVLRREYRDGRAYVRHRW